MPKPYYQAAHYHSSNSIGFLLKRAHALMLDRLEPLLAAQELSFIQFTVLMSLRHGTALNPKDICSLYCHDSGALTRVIDQLEARGWLTRSRSSADRRAIELHLTPAGSRRIEKVVPLVVELLNQGLQDFQHAEIDELIRLLHKLIASLERRAGEGQGARA
jgi:DNA-binding MarR family transcriptional regulator